jgi:hypothetical protein
MEKSAVFASKASGLAGEAPAIDAAVLGIMNIAWGGCSAVGVETSC